MIREAGKTWREADADICEAIDFCEYYARVAVGLFQPTRLGRFVGELNCQWYQPRGVAAIISPWNFPLAICCGMTAAALVTGNTAIVKPSSQTRAIARRLCEILWQAGVPAEVLQFLPGSGGEVGDMLVRDPRVAMIAFTGSKDVGLRILKLAGDPPPGQALRQEGCVRDGRQECDHRRRIGRPGRSRAGHPAIGLRLQRAEVFGLQPGDRLGRHPRRATSPPGGIDTVPW